MTHSNPDHFSSSQNRSSQKKFIFISIFLSLTFSLIVAEWVLSYQQSGIRTSDDMEPGMVLYDANLGWKLKPYWKGKHHHYDYDVSYSINKNGFRGKAAPDVSDAYAIVGDSFSFGLGVEDEETFTALLASEEGAFYNLSVPGYSTDQQLLLIKKHKQSLSHHVLLVVYLGNDLFDNMRAYPLQANHGKPYYILENNRLVLRNTPVPKLSKPAAARKETISSIVLGDGYSSSNTLFDRLSRFEISRRLGLFQKNHVLDKSTMQLRFDQSLALLVALLNEIKGVMDDEGGELGIVLLPGRSYVEKSESVSAQYQNYFRESILTVFDDQKSPRVIDLASHLRQLFASGVTNMYHPNEGHLTAKGHQHVADFLSVQLTKNQIAQ